MGAVWWLRRDLRLADNPTLLAAAADGPVAALFVLDESLMKPSGQPRLAFLYRTLRALDADLRAHGGALTVRRGRPEQVVPSLVREIGASSVHVSADFGPYGTARDERVEAALGELAPRAERTGAKGTRAGAGVPLVRTGSPYAVAPGRVTKADGTPFKVYSAFYRGWLAHGWRAPAASDPAAVQWHTGVEGDPIPDDPSLPSGLRLPDAGEAAAQAAWAAFRSDHLGRYSDERNRPDLDSTSRLSPYLRFGSLHPRTLLHELGAADETFRKELAWREFYAAVLHFWPASARENFTSQLTAMSADTGPDAAVRLQAWQQGRTGYPIVDAGMRQLAAEGWMHNRVRMIVASFLVKDLHLDWTSGARHFMRHLVDGDLASNQHGWQWTAGTGTDAAPYYRVFNPTMQGRKFDPDGHYIRRYVPELAALNAHEIHEPWLRPAGGPAGYPEPIVEHARERDEALRRYEATRQTTSVQ